MRALRAFGDSGGPRLLLRRLHRDSLLRNSAFIMATTLVTSALGFAYWLIAAHLYPVRTIGLAAALVSAMTLTSVLFTFGIQASLVRRLARRSSGPDWSATLNAGLAASGALAGVGGIVGVFVLPLVSPRFDVVRSHPAYAIAFALGVVLTTLSTVLDYTFIAERSAGKMLARAGVASLLKIPLVAAPVVFASVGVLGILGSWVMASLGGVALAALLVRRLNRNYRVSFTGTLGEMRAILPSLAAHHTVNVAAGLPMFALPLLVAVQLSAADNAYFYTTWMVGSVFFIISPAVSWSLFAEGSRRDAELGPALRRSVAFVAALLIPLMLIALGGRHLILSSFGTDYAAHGTGLLTILVLSAIPDAITNLFVSVMRVRATLGRAALLNVGMAVETIVLAWILLPTLGIAGAGWAWLIAQTSGSIAVVAYVARPRIARILRSLGTTHVEGEGV